MTVLILDTETTGLTPKDQVIELAYMVLEEDTRNLNFTSTFNERFRPIAKINPHAQAVHGIAFRDLIRCNSTTTIPLPDKIEYIIGHNISFDKRMLIQSNPRLTPRLEAAKYICTRELARVVAKQFKIPYLNNKLDTIIKHHFEDRVEELIPEHHEALSDCRKCFEYLKVILELLPALDTWDKVYSFQQLLNKDTYANKTA